MNSLNPAKLAIRSLRFFAKSHLSVGLGIAAATAVIVGALVVGDSVRGSLRRLVLDRLANVEGLLHAPTFFEPRLLDELSYESTSDSDQPTNASDTASKRESQDKQSDGGASGHIIPLIYLPSSTVERRTTEGVHRSTKLQIFGATETFWKNIAPQATELTASLQADEIALNQSLATELQAQVGDEVTLHFDRAGGVPPDSPLGNRDGNAINLPRQRIVAILPDVGVGGLSFASSQTVPRNVFCHAATLQDALECGTRFNAALALPPPSAALTPEQADQWCRQLDSQLHPVLEDYGLKLERITLRFPNTPQKSGQAANTGTDQAEVTTGDPAGDSATTITDYYQLSSRKLLIDNATVHAISDHFDGSETKLLAYLANTITKVTSTSTSEFESTAPDSDSILLPESQRSRRYGRMGRGRTLTGPVAVASRPVPYSIVVGVEESSVPLMQPYTAVDGMSLRYSHCWINSWLAQQLDAKPSDWLEISYFEPETIDGREHQRQARFMVAGIVPLTEPEQGYRRGRPAVYATPPTIFNDPNLTPTVPGLTDKDSIASWDAPFPLDMDLIKPADDDYFERYRLTPKLFLSYYAAASNELFGSRFGQTTSIRFPIENSATENSIGEAQLREKIAAALLELRPENGFRFESVRSKLLKAAAGTTPFDMLFLSLSFFVIVAALMLVALLFKLGISQRTSQLGLLAAQGFSPARIRGLLLRELALVALGGASLGVALGLGYAWAMVATLQTWWVGAISAPFLTFSFTWPSLLIGASAGLLMSICTLDLVLRRASRQAPLELLRGGSEETSVSSLALRRGLLVAAALFAMSAMSLLIAGIGQTGMARAGSFFGCGMLLLIAGLLAIHYALQSRASLDLTATSTRGLLSLAWRTVGRNPLRSSLALGLLSVASFLIASMSVFQVSPDSRGYGGFDLIAESSQPIYRDIASGTVRAEQLGSDAKPLEDALILAARMKPGQDASCNNLFQVEQPTILGIPDRLEQLKDFTNEVANFQWAAEPDGEWLALEAFGEGTAESPMPVILDQNTAAWSLKQGASPGAPIVLKYGDRELHFRTVGLLANSVLQGKLMISESNFKKLFPELNGYRFFLIHSGQSGTETEVAAALEKGWSAEGLDVTSSRETLQRLLGVQNTYISAFQSLGALGLLLGTFGLIAVQLRSVWERRRELALLQAIGFSKSRIAHMLTLETALLLGGGLLLGSLAATIALLPYVIENGTRLSLLGPLAMLAGVLLAGFIAAIIAVHSAMKKTVLAGLRSE
ncbi:MAG: ABC transporter permease [Planctomycetales bacterium]|nr:ABC transporter permease [Planctomycetales bacterium]